MGSLHDPVGGRFAAPGFRAAEVEAVTQQLAAAGFQAIEGQEHRVGRTLHTLSGRAPDARAGSSPPETSRRNS